MSAAICPLELWTSFQAHTVREKMESGCLKEAQVEVSGNGGGGEPKIRSG